MAWNQPTSTEHSARRSKPRKPSKGVWLVATAFVVVAAAVVAIALLPRGKVTPSAVVEKPVKTKVAIIPPMPAPKPQQPVEVKVGPGRSECPPHQGRRSCQWICDASVGANSQANWSCH